MKRIFGLILAMLSLVFVVSCKSEKGYIRFMEHSISTKGVLTWNKIEKAKYYYVTTGSFEDEKSKWIKSNKIDLSSEIIDVNGHINVSVEAYSSKLPSGRVSPDEKLRVYIIKQAGNFYLEEEAIKYTVKFDTGGAFEVPDLIDYRLGFPKTIDESYYFTFYYDKECTQEVINDRAILTSDMTLYAKYEIITCRVRVYGDTIGNTGTNTVVKEFMVDIDTVIEETDIPASVPKSGYTFIYWEVKNFSSSREIVFPFKVTTYTDIYPVFKRN